MRTMCLPWLKDSATLSSRPFLPTEHFEEQNEDSEDYDEENELKLQKLLLMLVQENQKLKRQRVISE